MNIESCAILAGVSLQPGRTIFFSSGKDGLEILRVCESMARRQIEPYIVLREWLAGRWS